MEDSAALRYFKTGHYHFLLNPSHLYHVIIHNNRVHITENNHKAIRPYVVLPLHHSALLFLKQSINEVDINFAEKKSRIYEYRNTSRCTVIHH
jgi:hypothetical protein